ncbi:MAG: hypothetical protein R3B48_07995 [Kofleriaceae bacterium]
MPPRPSLKALDRHLRERDLHLEAVAVGGSALGLLRVFQRPTRNFDIVTPATAQALAECSPWLEEQDVKLWPAHVRETLADLARRLRHGV